MAIVTFRIELRVDFRGTDKDDIIQELVEDTAKQLFATATILSDGPKPVIKVIKAPFFGGDEEIKLKLEDA